MPSIFTLGGPTKKAKKAKKSSGSKLAMGECKCVVNSRTKARVQLCRTGKGRSGHQFKKGGC